MTDGFHQRRGSPGQKAEIRLARNATKHPQNPQVIPPASDGHEAQILILSE